MKKILFIVSAFIIAIVLFMNFGPEDVTELVKTGRALIKKNKFDEAIIPLSKAIKVAPKNVDAYNNLAFAYHNKGEYTVAEQFFKKAIEINPNNALGYAYLGEIEEERYNFAKAVEFQEKSISLNPDYAWVYNSLASNYEVLGQQSNTDEECLKQYEKAFEYYKKALALDSEIAEYYNNYGGALGTMLRFDEAISILNRGLEKFPNNEILLYTLAHFYHKMGNYAKSEEYLFKAIKINPKIGMFYDNLGMVYCDTNRVEDGLKQFEKAIELSPRDPNPYNNMAFVYDYKLGDKSKALHYYKKYLELSRGEPQGDIENIKKRIKQLEPEIKHNITTSPNLAS